MFPIDVEFATKPELAQRMLTDALEAGVLASWVAGDEVYGADTALRTSCREHGVGYVLDVACNHHLVTAQCRVDAVVAQMPTFAWQRLSAGAGSKGPRMYSWLLIDVASTLPGHEWIMVRRNDSTGELAYYRCWSPHLVPLTTLVRVAGRRWTIEESFQAAKGQAGLDEHQVRTWTSWRRWVILSMLAMAFLAVTCANERDGTATPRESDSVHPQRNSASIRQTHPRPKRHPGHHLGMVTLAPKTPSHRPSSPLSTQVRALLNPIYNCSTNGASPQPDEACLGRRWCGGSGRLETVTGGPVRCMNRM